MKVDVEYMLDEDGHQLTIHFPGQQPYYLTYDLAPDGAVCQVHLKEISWAKLGITDDVPGLLLSLHVLSQLLEDEYGPTMFIIDPAYLDEHHFPNFIASLSKVVEQVGSDVGPRLIVKVEAIAKCWHDVFGDEPVIINSEKDPN